MNRAALKRAIEHCEGLAPLAEALGCVPPVVSSWLSRGVVPAYRCVAIERVTKGAITCHELRPDIFLPPKEVQAA